MRCEAVPAAEMRSSLLERKAGQGRCTMGQTAETSRGPYHHDAWDIVVITMRERPPGNGEERSVLFLIAGGEAQSNHPPCKVPQGSRPRPCGVVARDKIRGRGL